MAEKNKAENQNNTVTTEQKETNNTKPKGIVRPIGLGAVAGVLGGGLALGYLFAADLVKWAVIEGLERGFSAEANIESVAISWHPFGVSINKLQQTDSGNANLNLFQFDHAKGQINLFELMLGKTVIEELNVSGLMLSQPRATAGQVFLSQDKPTKDDAEAQESGLLNKIQLPNAEQVLANSDLITEQKARQLQQVVKVEKEKLNAVIKSLPNDDKLADYEDQWRKIKSTKIKSLADLESIKQQLKQLKNDINTDRKNLKLAKSQYKESKTKIDHAYQELKQAPDQDWQQIKQQYPLDNPNAIAISKLLLGDKVTGYLATADEYWQKLKPYIDAHKEVKEQDKLPKESMFTGKNYEFPLVENWPDWLVKSLNIDMKLGQDLVAYRLSATEVTIQSYVRNIATRYELAQQQNPENSLTVTGEYYVDEQNQFTTQGNWNSHTGNYKMANIITDGEVNIGLANSKLAGQGSFKYNQALTSTHTLEFSDANFTGSGGTKLADITLSSLQKVNTFEMALEVNGDIKQPDVSLSSDLDRQLSKAVKGELEKSWQTFKADTQDGLEQKLQQKLGLQQQDMARIEQWQQQLQQVTSVLSGKGDSESDALVKNLKDKYQDELKQKAKDKLEAKRKKEEDKLKEKLKEKLKGIF